MPRSHTIWALALSSLGFVCPLLPTVALAESVAITAETAELLTTAAQLVEQANAWIADNDPEQWQQALEHYQQAQQIYAQQAQPLKIAEMAHAIGSVYEVNFGQSDRALHHYQESLKLYQAAENPELEAFLLAKIGNVYGNLWQHETALDHLHQALEIRTALELTWAQASTYNSLALVHSNRGDVQTALDYYQQALDIYDQTFAPGDSATVLTHMGHEYWLLGDRNQGLDHYLEAWKLIQFTDDSLGQGLGALNLGTSYLELGEPDWARDFLNQAQSYFADLNQPHLTGLTLTYLGQLEAQAGRSLQAVRHYEQALAQYTKPSDRLSKAFTLNVLGQIYQQQNRLQAAQRVHEQALKIYQTVESRYDQTLTEYELAKVFQAQGDRPRAIAHIEQAIAHVEAIRHQITNRDLQTHFFASQQDLYELQIELLMEEGKPERALEVSERARARSLIELLAESRLDLRQGVDPELLAQERQLHDQLQGLEQQRRTQLERAPLSNKVTASQQTYTQVLQDLEKVQAQIRNTSPRYAALTQPEPLELAAIQQELDDETIVLEYQLGEQQSYLWLVTNQTVESYKLPPRAEIEAAIRDLRRRIQRRRGSVATVQAVSDLLLGPVAHHLHGQRLVIVPQGAVAYVPFAALINPQRPSQEDGPVPLVVDHELVTLPSVSTLAVLREQTADRDAAPKTLAIVSDPVFNHSDPRLKAMSSQSEATNLSLYSAQIASAARSAGLNWQRLPYTQVEAEAIAALIPPDQQLQASGLTASLDTLTQQDLTDYQVLHFATHGLLNSEDPRLSALVLSLFDEQGQHQDGYLRLHEIYNLELAAELVVLSACETGIGKAVRGEGVMGLTRGFMYAGAERVVVSLWAVDDQGTAELMQRFYQQLWQQELTPAAALRAAQLEMWRSQGWDAPYYWAGFTLQGEWR